MGDDFSKREIADTLAEASGNRTDKKDEPYTAEAVQNNKPDFLAGADRVKRQDLVKSMIYGKTIERYVNGKPRTRQRGSAFRIIEGIGGTFATRDSGKKLLGYLLAAAVVGGSAASIYLGIKMNNDVRNLKEKKERVDGIQSRLYEEFKRGAHEEPTEK